MVNYITGFINHYGYIVLFIALTMELVAFPFPGETLMTYCGFLVFQGKLNWIISMLVASCGAITGITISYFIGRVLGKTFFNKYGSYIHLSPEKLDKTSKWFDKYGNGLLIVAFFIPGIRHITGYFSGITKISYKRFALNAGIGAIIWTGTFISLGKLLGDNWESSHGTIKKFLIIGGIITGLIIFSIYIYKSYKQHIIEFAERTLEYSFRIFHSLGKIRVIVMGAVTVFLALLILVAGLIQDFLAKEFSELDTVSSTLMSIIFPSNWKTAMEFFGFLTSDPVLILLSIFLTFWIIIKKSHRFLEFRFLILTVLGGEIFNQLLRIIFHRVGPLGLSVSGLSQYTFPSEQSLMAVVVYGFAAFLILRHTKKKIRKITISIVMIICFLSALNPLFFHLEYTSDVVAGYVFGGLWLTLNIILLEIFRVLPEIEYNNK